MKRISLLMLALLFLLIVDVKAQGWVIRNRPVPKWISDKGFWQVESNINSTKNHTVYFYTNDHVLVYKEDMKNVRLDITKASVRMKFKRALETAIAAWKKEHPLPHDRAWLAALFK